MLEFLAELGMELLGEIAELFLESGRVKVWVKTVFFFLLGAALCVGVGHLGLESYRDGNLEGAVISGVVAGLFVLITLAGAVYGHKKGWKQKMKRRAKQ